MPFRFSGLLCLLLFAAASSAWAGPSRITFAFQKQLDPRELQRTTQELTAFLEERLDGVRVDVVVPASYGATVQALVSNRAQVAYVSALPFLLAREEAPVRFLLAEVREERTEYDSIFVVAADSPFQTLEDLRGKRMMFTSATSTSGYVMPYSRLVDEGLLEKRQSPTAFFGSINYAGGYDRALLAVANGQADACAVSAYTMEGPKADLYMDAARRANLRILTRTSGVPTHGISIRSDLPEELQERIKAALLALSEERPDLLADVYGASSLVEVDEEEHLAGAVSALDNTGLGLRGLVR